MMTCKDCIHYEPCFSGGQSVWNNIEQTTDDCCKHFKNKNCEAEAIKELSERLKAESEKHSDECLKCYAKGLSECAVEIERKDKQIQELVSFQRFCESKALEEFVERLKDAYPNRYLVWGGGKHSVCFDDFIDNILKEMGVENNA